MAPHIGPSIKIKVRRGDTEVMHGGAEARTKMWRHCEEPSGPAEGRPKDRLRDEAAQNAGSLRSARDDG